MNTCLSVCRCAYLCSRGYIYDCLCTCVCYIVVLSDMIFETGLHSHTNIEGERKKRIKEIAGDFNTGFYMILNWFDLLIQF